MEVTGRDLAEVSVLSRKLSIFFLGLLGRRKGWYEEHGILRSDINVWECLSLFFFGRRDYSLRPQE